MVFSPFLHETGNAEVLPIHTYLSLGSCDVTGKLTSDQRVSFSLSSFITSHG